MNFAQVVSAVALASYLILLVLVGRNARRSESRAFFMFLLAMAFWQGSIAVVAFTDNPATALIWYELILGLGSSFGLFYALFVRRLLGIQSHPRLMHFGFIVAVTIVGWTLAGGGHLVDGVYRDQRSTFWLPTLGVVAYPMSLYVYGYLAYGLVNLVRYYRITTSSLTRNRLRYLIIGVSIVFAGSTSNFSDALKAYPIDVVANLLNAVLIAYAILRYQLLDISVVIRKGVLYSVPAVMISGSYLFTVFLATNLFHAVTGYQALFLSFLTAMITAVALQPLWTRIQARVDRLFFREKYDAGLMVQRLSRTVSSVLDLKNLGDTILLEITTTLHVEKGALLLKEKTSSDFTLAASVGLVEDADVRLGAGNPIVEWLARNAGILSQHDIDVMPQFRALWTREIEALDRLGAELFVPLLVQKEVVGILVLGPKLSDVSYAEDEQGMLLTLANQTAMAVQNAWLYQTAVEEKERTEVIVSQAFSGIMVVDGDMQVLTLNPGAESITGYSREELVGKPLPALFDPIIWAADGPLAKAANKGEAMTPLETALSSREGPRDIILGVTPINAGFLLNFTDITRLKEVDRLKSQIVANVSHELRTPLASIKGYSDFLLEGYAGQDEELQRRFLTIINEETDRLAGFINDLLDLSRLESGRIEPRMEDVNFEELIGDAVDMLQIQAGRAGVSIHVDVPDELPIMRGSKELLSSVVKNLVGNAIKFSPAGGRVDVTARCVDNELVFSVADQGIGIPSEDLPYLFSKFYRSMAVRDAGIRGTGLGLVLAKEAVLAHHGSIAVDSAPGNGTRFTVTVPLDIAETRPGSPSTPAGEIDSISLAPGREAAPSTEAAHIVETAPFS